MTIASNAAIGNLKAYQFASDAFLFLFLQTLAPDEVSLVEFGDPTQVSFQQRGGLVDFVAIQTHAGFQAQCVPRGETARQDTIIRSKISGVQHLVPKLFGFVRGRINLEPIFAGVARA